MLAAALTPGLSLANGRDGDTGERQVVDLTVGRDYSEDAARSDLSLAPCDDRDFAACRQPVAVDGLDTVQASTDREASSDGWGSPDQPGAMDKGLTSLRSFTPTGAEDFKTAATCHYRSGDWYAVLAVFEMDDGDDELWWLKVDGLSSSSDYGRVVSTRRITTEEEIHSVNCADDGNRTVYFTWDRSDSPTDHLNARWASITNSGIMRGPYTIPKCRDWPGYLTLQSWAPDIAFNDDTVALSYAGRFSCSFCWSTWTSNGDYIGGDAAWGGDGHAEETAIEWNGRDAFMLGVIYPRDGGGTTVFTHLVYPDGSSKFDLLEAVDHGPLDWTVSDLELVYTPNSRNTYRRMLVDTSLGTVWVSRNSGAAIGDRVTPSVVRRVSCEYWGPRRRIANSFGSPPRFGLTPHHLHQQSRSGDPREVYDLDDYDYTWPAACSSSDTFTDPEVLLVRGSMLMPWNRGVYVSIEPED